MTYPVSIKEKAVHLYVDKHCTYAEIHKRLGVAESTLSVWINEVVPSSFTKDRRRQALSLNRYKPPKKFRGRESVLHQKVPAKGKSRQWKAKVAEAAALLHMLVYGFNAFGSLFDGDRTDWLVEIPATGAAAKVQVKWAGSSNKHGLPTLHLTCVDQGKQRAYQKGEFDFIVGYDYFTDTCYVWAWAEVSGQSLKTIERDAAEAWHKLALFH